MTFFRLFPVEIYLCACILEFGQIIFVCLCVYGSCTVYAEYTWEYISQFALNPVVSLGIDLHLNRIRILIILCSFSSAKTH